jgi:hypothetical protein
MDGGERGMESVSDLDADYSGWWNEPYELLSRSGASQSAYLDTVVVVVVADEIKHPNHLH